MTRIRMKKRTFALILILVVFSANSKLFCQDNNPITTVVPWLTIAPDSRAGALGDAGVATSPDVYSMHWNPAKFAFIDGKAGIGISYIPWLRALIPDINLAFLSGYYRFDKKQVISASLMYSSYGKVDFTDNDGNPQLTVNPNEWAFDLGYSRLFSNSFSGGIAFRFIYSNLTFRYPAAGESTKPGLSIAADVSGYYHTDLKLRNKNAVFALGFNFSNIGAKMSYTDSRSNSEFIPMNLRLGTSFTFDFDNYNKVTFCVDLNKLLVPTPPIYYMVGEVNQYGDTVKVSQSEIKSGKDPNVSVPVAIFRSFYDAPDGFKEEMREITSSYGLEYWYNNLFALRAGYFHENAYKGNRKYFTVGAGFRLRGFTLDFSYLMPVVQNQPLARTLRFSLSFDMSSFRNINKSRT
jgi:hypothetical protein